MKSKNRSSKIIKYILALFVLVLASTLSTGVQAKDSENISKSPDNNQEIQGKQDLKGYIAIDFNNVDINVFIKFFSELTSTNFVVDDRVKGKVTIISPNKVSIEDAYKVFESVLEVHGYTTIKSGEITKIVPSPDARSKNIETWLKQKAASPEDRVVTQLIPLKFANPTDIKKLFVPLVSKSSVILDYPPTNMLIITDVYSNIKRLLRILNAIDVSGMGQELSVIPLEYAEATKFVKILDSIFQEQRRTKARITVSGAKFVADERTNTIIVMASEVETLKIKELINMLDLEIPRGKEKIHVYYLENANAEDMAKVLQELPTKATGDKKGPQKKLPFVSEDVKITADKATNSLIIMAGKEDYQVLDEIIKKLDVPRSMVYIECLIMEVNVNKEFNLGVQWQAGGTTTIDNKDAAFGGGFEPEVPIISGIQTTLPSPSGFSMGIFTERITIGGMVFPNLAAIVNAYKKDKDVHFLSTPQILTTDNEEASITVGKNVPFQTRSAADSGVETYSSYEYKDVGITMKITPQISHDRLVRLYINTESTKLDEQATTSSDRPTTLKRTVDTTVIVKDTNTVVIGGLIDDSFSETTYTVPCLGDIPFFGYLFKTKSTGGDKTNLFLFITPHVVENPAEAKAILDNKKDEIDKIKEGKIKLYEKSFDKIRDESKQ